MKSSIMTGIVALVALTASDAAAQSETWQLAEVNGAGLPAITEQDDDGCREEVTSGTLTLAGDGTWTLVTQEREVCGNAVEEESEEEQGRYAAQADGIRFTEEDDDDGEEDDGDGADEDLDDLARGTRAGSTLTVRSEDGATVLVFRR